MNVLDLFTGGGGGVLASKALGHNIVGMCEIDPGARAIITARMADKNLPTVPFSEDVTTLDGKAFRGVDMICGGFPCQDLSSMNVNGKGLKGPRSKLGWHMLRIAIESGADYIFAENVTALRGNGLHDIIGVAAQHGYGRAIYGVAGAKKFGGHHRRNRLWLLLGKGAASPINEVRIGQIRPVADVAFPTPLRHDAQEAEAYCRGRNASLPQILGITRRAYDFPDEVPRADVRPKHYIPGARLNPLTYESLMGWPLGWTNTRVACASDKITAPVFRRFPLLTVADPRAIRALGNGQVPLVAAYMCKRLLAEINA